MQLKFKVSNSVKLKGIRCLLATASIKKGELLEECPVVLIPNTQMPHIEASILAHYEFYWDETNEALVLGYGSLYNHSFDPNVEFEQDFNRNLMIFKARKDIESGEELLINYQEWESPNNLDPDYINFKF